MRAKLANVNHCAVPFVSRAAVNLCGYYYTAIKDLLLHYSIRKCNAVRIVLQVANRFRTILYNTLTGNLNFTEYRTSGIPNSELDHICILYMYITNDAHLLMLTLA